MNAGVAIACATNAAATSYAENLKSVTCSRVSWSGDCGQGLESEIYSYLLDAFRDRHL